MYMHMYLIDVSDCAILPEIRTLKELCTYLLCSRNVFLHEMHAYYANVYPHTNLSLSSQNKY